MARQSKTGASSGACRFCGQSVIVEDGAEMTAPQLEEAATMLCGCDEAIKYQQEKNRRTVAKQRVGGIVWRGRRGVQAAGRGAADFIKYNRRYLR